MGVLAGLSGTVAELAARHERPIEELWFPNDLLGTFFNSLEEKSLALRERLEAIPGELRAALVLNLLTEEGLPHFHRLIALHMGEESPWNDWNNLWTAEESRHGDAIGKYVSKTGIIDDGALERMTYAYVRAGFHPNWGKDPYRLLAYTSLQEHATQISHAKLGTRLTPIEPVLGRLLHKIAGDEARHYAFYRNVFLNVLRADPDEALVSLLAVMRSFAMPGLSAPNFSAMAEIQERADLFTTSEYKKIVVTLIKFWNIPNLTPTSDAAKRTLDRIVQFPALLDRKIEGYANTKKTPKTFELGFLTHPITV
jgi:acyl-[acyl-carrier-protein] desaturase